MKRLHPRMDALLPFCLAWWQSSQSLCTCCCCSEERTSLMPNFRVSSFRLSLALHLRINTRSSSVANVMMTARHDLLPVLPWRLASEADTRHGRVCSTSLTLSKRPCLFSPASSSNPVSLRVSVRSVPEPDTEAGAVFAAAAKAVRVCLSSS